MWRVLSVLYAFLPTYRASAEAVRPPDYLSVRRITSLEM